MLSIPEKPLLDGIKSVREDNRLEAIDRNVMERIEAKDWFIAEVVANRRSLKEAAARFLGLAEEGLDRPMRVMRSLPGATTEEKFRLQLLLWAESSLYAAPSGLGHEVLARLRREHDEVGGGGEGHRKSFPQWRIRGSS